MPAETPPTDGDLRDRIAAALRAHHIDLTQVDRAQEADRCVCGELVDDWDAHWIDAVLAVRDDELAAAWDQIHRDQHDAMDARAELERLRGELAEARDALSRMTTVRNAAKAMNGVYKLHIRRQRQRAEQAEDLLRIAHDTSNRSEAERARAVQRAEEAEDRLRKATDAYTRLQAQADDAAAARDRWRERGKQAEVRRDALIDEVKTLQADLEKFGEAQKAWVQFRRERDALKAAIEELRNRWYRQPGRSEDADALDQILDENAALDAPSGAHSPAEPRTGVPRHTDATRETGEAQEATE
jgi:chromosome segregation ATPase